MKATEMLKKQHREVATLFRKALNSEQPKQKTQLAQEIVEKLAVVGVRIRVEDIEKFSGGKTIGRPHVARAIVETGAVGSVKEAFDRYLGEGRPAFVGRYRLEAADAVRLVRAAGFPYK